MNIELIGSNSISSSSDVTEGTLVEDPFIYIEENNIDRELCERIIDHFENDHRKMKGVFGGKWGTIDEKVKNTLDLAFSSFTDSHWMEIDKLLFFSLKHAICRYYKKIMDYHIKYEVELFDSGFQIQKYEKNKGKYVWHHDSMTTAQQHRVFTFIWYLNDVLEGGETYFLNGKIKPTAGKLLLFPSTWTYMHKGDIPISNNKYIITGWISTSNRL
jgi:hypothetical protein